MKQQRRRIVKSSAWIAAAATMLNSAVSLGQAAGQSPRTAATELADRLEVVAFTITAKAAPTPANQHSVELLYQAAAKINPTESRYDRELANWYFQCKDEAGAAEALRSYLTILPDDQYAQTCLITLYINQMQTADSTMSYLRGLVAKTVLPAPVRAFAAVKCAEILLGRSQKDEALKILDTALQIEPLNNAALRLKYTLSSETEGASRRVGLLLALLRSNPMDPDAAVALGQEIADVGLSAESSQIYSLAFNLYRISGKPLPPELARGGATELYLSGRVDDALTLIDSLLAGIPGDAEAWNIRLAMSRDNLFLPKLPITSFDTLSSQAVTGLTNQLQQIRAAAGMAGTDQAPAAIAPDTTQPSSPDGSMPSTQPLVDVPDLSGDLPILVKTNDSRLTDQYLAAASDLAWLRLYFLRDTGPATQKLLDSLAKLLPPDDVQMIRLSGWNLLLQGKYPEAKATFSKISDHDPYAALGLVWLDDQAGHKADGDALAREVLAAHPSGSAAAVLFSALRARGAKPIPIHQAEAVKAEIDAFPKEWFDIVTQPQEFFSVSADPVADQIAFGEALLARVTVRNTSNFDLTIGDDGTMKPALAFDVSVRGLVEKQLPGAITDNFWRRELLPAGQSASQLVRLDFLAVSDALNTEPLAPADVEIGVVCNPVRTKTGIVPGGCGFRTSYSSPLERTATPLNSPDDRKQLYDLLSAPSSADRFLAAEKLLTFSHIEQAKAQGANADAELNLAKEMYDHAIVAFKDTDPAVRAWTLYLIAVSGQPDQQQSIIRALALSDDWYSRLLGLLAAHRLLPDSGQAAANALSGDKDPIVKGYAKVVLDQIAESAAAQPGAQP